MPRPDPRRKLQHGGMLLRGGARHTLPGPFRQRAGTDAARLGACRVAGSLGPPGGGLRSAAEARRRIFSIADLRLHAARWQRPIDRTPGARCTVPEGTGRLPMGEADGAAGLMDGSLLQMEGSTHG